jgi:hypothetical protein
VKAVEIVHAALFSESAKQRRQALALLEALGPQAALVADLLRQRLALRDSGGDPDTAAPRAERTVEGYLG